ncbi:MAG: ABC transporter permease [Proteobacteria bacterium]|nr:ABC transporter [Desulfobacteraceae bacterium]MBU4013041.1 ABC transporter permease [Pseudomonadota bacterium]MBU4069221.1 ABC transporter permease [Pseudomonadota bacterium]MCG2759307.1 ABC transporter permease [Desulfobacteraceae bacterium]MCG2831531.1 ABC transporter permease [Desulfobacteraceae bacterium]
MKGWFAVYLREILILRRKLFKQIASMAVSPLLYLVAFGFAMGRDVIVQDHTYLEFLIPGLVAMSSMTQAFAIAGEINIARFYWHIFEEFQAAPLSNMAYVTGEVLAGITRALLSVCIILCLSLVFGIVLSYNFWFWLAIIINAMIFSALAVCVAMLVKSHADQVLVTNFIIMPMAFLGGTFFPLDRMPVLVQKVLGLLPLTHAAKAIRASSFGMTPNPWSYVLLAGLGCVFFFMALRLVDKAKD